MTTKGLDVAVKYFAGYQRDVTPAVEDILRRAALNKDEDTVRMGVRSATVYGATSMLKVLTYGWDNTP